MKVYNGWILNIKGEEFVVAGSNKIRGRHYYVLRGKNGVASMDRDEMVQGINGGAIKYVGNSI